MTLYVPPLQSRFGFAMSAKAKHVDYAGFCPLHASRIREVLLRIILTERDREIAGPGWCVCAAGLGREPASDGNRTASGQIGEESTG
ncbi:MAG: hypothetical protein ABGX22_04945 [Pirellulaceae bacterium]|jgi:hypothetical protein